MFSVRTIFLFLRGVDQTGRAFEPADKRLKKLMKTQMDMSRTAYRLMFAGAAFTAFAAMAGQAMLGLLEKTSLGQLYLSDFGRVLDRIKQSLAEAIIDKFGPLIETWLQKLDDLSKNETFMKILAGITVPAIIALGTIGPVLLAAGVGMTILSKIALALANLGLFKAAGVVSLVGGMGIQIAVAVAITMAVAQIIWHFLPESYKTGVMDIKKKAQEWANEVGIPVQIGQRDVVYPEGQKPGGLFGYKGPRRWTPQQITINTQNFFQDVKTREDEEDIPKLIEDSYINAMKNRGLTGPEK